MPDREKVISNLEQQIRWIEEIECHQFPGWLNVTNAMRDAIVMLKEQEQTINALESDLKETLQVLGEKGSFRNMKEYIIGVPERTGVEDPAMVPAINQRELVRCKDCKWWHESEREVGFGDCGQANGITLKPSNWFCADGERK